MSFAFAYINSPASKDLIAHEFHEAFEHHDFKYTVYGLCRLAPVLKEQAPFLPADTVPLLEAQTGCCASM
jgi:hypothetical protein